MRISPNPTIAATLGAALLLAMPLAAHAEPVSLTGEVTYRERIALPPDATLTVQLVDAAQADAPATIAAELALDQAAGQVPVRFRIEFDDSLLVPEAEYQVNAEIRAGDTLMFRNAEPYPVDPLAGALPETIVLSMVGTPEDDVPEGEVPEGEVPEVEVEVPEAELPEVEAPEIIGPDVSLIGTGWVLETVGGAPAAAGVTSSLVLGEDGSAGGNGGCNSYGGDVTIDGASLSFSQIASTLMACPEPAMSQERALFDALGATARYEIDLDGRLSLFDAEGGGVATFTPAEG